MGRTTRVKTNMHRPFIDTEERHKRGYEAPKSGKACPTMMYDEHRFPYMARTLCAHYGCTDKQLGAIFGVSHKTVESWTTKYPEFKAAKKDGRDAYDTEKVEHAFLKRAMGFEYVERTTRRVYLRGTNEEGIKVKVPAQEVTEVTRYIPPDVKACIYWLQNRDPERWRAAALQVNANVKSEQTQASVKVKADLSNMNLEQLRTLRELVSHQQDHQVIDITPQENELLALEHLLNNAEQVLDADYVSSGGAE